jgi:hypothetical protein
MEGKRVLLVEGPDDEHVVRNFLGRRELVWLHEIKAQGGVNELLDALPVRLKQSDVGSLGILVDADGNPAGRWQSIKQRLNQAGFQSLPEEPQPGGIIAEPPSGTLLPRVGIWLMPNNTTAGILETFLECLVPADGRRLLNHAERSLDTIPIEERLFTDLQRPKALIHTWLAWQHEPGRPLGQAITARTLDANAEGAELLASWFRRLYLD